MTVRNTTTFAILGIANFAVWIAALIHLNISFRQQREMVQTMIRMEKEQLLLVQKLEDVLEAAKHPTTTPSLNPVDVEKIKRTTEALNRQLVETDQKIR